MRRVCVITALAASMAALFPPGSAGAAVAPAYDLTPYDFAGPALAVVEAARAGRCGEVVEAWDRYAEEVPSTVRDVRIQFLAGRCLHRRGRHTEAIALLSRLPLAYPAMAAEIWHTLGKSLIARKRYHEAVAALLEIRPPRHRYAAAQILAARAALFGGDPYTTLTILADAETRLLRSWERANALGAMADAEAKLRNHARARLLRHRAWSRYPTTGAADKVDADIDAGRLEWPGPEAVLERVLGLVEANRLDTAKGLLDAFGARGGFYGKGVRKDPASAWRDLGYGELALANRNYEGARTYFEAALAAAKGSRLKARLRCRVGKARARTGDFDEARDAYESSLTPWPRGHFSAQCWHDYALLLQYYKRHAEARDAFLNSAERAAHDGNLRLRVESLWRVAWLTFRTGDHEEALKRFETIASESWPVPAMLREHDDWQSRKLGFHGVERAAYWAGRALVALGRKDKALDRWEWLARTFPLRYYGELAINRIEEIDPLRAAAIRDRSAATIATAIETDPVALGAVNASLLPIRRSGGVETGVEWFRLGLRAEATKALRGALLNDWLSIDGIVLLSSLYLEDDERHWRSHWVLKWRAHFRDYPYASADEGMAAAMAARTAEGELLDTEDTVALGTGDMAWWLCFPRGYAAEVEETAVDLGLDPALIYAVMRNESGFRVRVVSIAGALGLMQVLFKTAYFTATKLLKLKGVTRGTVFEPPVNVAIGARYLKELLHLFRGNVVLAVGGYNAGPYNAMRWWRRRPEVETDVFVEEIPIEQTYGYTRKVYASYAAYRYLYGGSSSGDTATVFPGRVPESLGTWMGKVITRRSDVEHPKHPARRPGKRTSTP